MARSYKLDSNAAKKAEQINSRLEKTGEYTGVFTRAEAVQSKKGTDGIEFSFKADSGETADYLSLWTYNSDGEELRGAQMVQALMTCMRARTLEAKPGTVEKYDRESGQRVPVKADIYPDLMNKRIGLLVQMEEYQANDGSFKWRPNIWGCFEPSTQFTATEILDKATKAERLTELVGRLQDKPLKSKPAAPIRPQSTLVDDPAFADDQIPF